MWKEGRRFILIVALLSVAGSAAGQDFAGCKQMDEILAELRHIRKLLENRPGAPGLAQPTTARIEVGSAPFLGAKEAPWTIVAFNDYQCPFCQQFHKQTFQDLKKIYIDSGEVRFYSLDLPLVEIHPQALLAAQAGRCAGEQGKFWPMHDRMLTNPEGLEVAKLSDYAQGIGMNVAAFRECVEIGKHKKAIEEGARDAASKGARGTPTFVIGKSTPAGVEGELVMGAVPLGVLENKLKELAR